MRTMLNYCKNCGSQTEHDILYEDNYGKDLACGVCGRHDEDDAPAGYYDEEDGL